MGKKKGHGNKSDHGGGGDGSRVPIHKMPPAVGAYIDAIMERDREWFERHPGAKQYLRPYVVGEIYPLPPNVEPDAMAVLVTQIAPGVRSRQIVTTPKPGDARMAIMGEDGEVVEVVDMPDQAEE